MGYYQMTSKGNTKANRTDPRYIEIFDNLRDLEFTVREARCIASEVVAIMNQNPELTLEEAYKKVMQ